MTTAPAATQGPEKPEGQKYQRRGQVAEHRGPVIGRAADDPIQGSYQNSSALSGHQFTHSMPIRQTSCASCGSDCAKDSLHCGHE